MDLLPITLGVNRPAAGGAGFTGSASARGKIAPDLKHKILERDNHTCRFCGFRSKKYQEIHNLSGKPGDLSDANLVTSCIFCHQCFRLDEVSKMKSGMLIWAPEIAQSDLHHLARAIYVARISQGAMADAARKSLDALTARREEAKNRVGTDNPYILSMVLKDYLGPKHYAERDKKLRGLRLFPLDRRIIREADLEFNQFPQILAYWRSKDGPFGGKAPPQWLSVYADVVRAA